ncbi:hypothetical protein AVEN_273156-1 [Araneus ventricosus]|uniref:Uncharacterized protein n=1 Tax=Araneus ventricosus TaxID=182803 RepID=A0A4Y2K2M0_ARAVE|nr:hypothetical protein AVEN_273156-1 [Araneus ventricosus]
MKRQARKSHSCLYTFLLSSPNSGLVKWKDKYCYVTSSHKFSVTRIETKLLLLGPLPTAAASPYSFRTDPLPSSPFHSKLPGPIKPVIKLRGHVKKRCASDTNILLLPVAGVRQMVIVDLRNRLLSSFLSVLQGSADDTQTVAAQTKEWILQT